MTAIQTTVAAGVGVASMALSAGMQILSGGTTAIRVGGLGRGNRGGGLGRGNSGGAVGKLLGRLEMPRLHMAMFTTGGIGLAGTGLGRLLNEAVTWLNNGVAHLATQWLGLGLGWLVSFGAVVVLLVDVRDDNCTLRTLLLCVAMPFLVAAIPGPIGMYSAELTSWIGSLVGGFVGSLFGMK